MDTPRIAHADGRTGGPGAGVGYHAADFVAEDMRQQLIYAEIETLTAAQFQKTIDQMQVTVAEAAMAYLQQYF